MLGAGPAGLAAAYRAALRGARVEVLERADRVGGAAGSLEIAGVRVDHGSHRLHPTTDPAILAELRTLLGDDLQLRERNGRIRLAGRWIGFPLRTLDLVRRLPPAFAAGAARDAILPRSEATGDTFADVLLAGLGPTMCHAFYFPYARKLWGLDPHELWGEQARRRVSAGSSRALLRRVVSRRTGRLFWYPRRGYGQLWERLADAATAAGVRIHLSTQVEALRLDDDGVTVDVAGGAPIRARRVWSTVPLPAVVRLVASPTLPDAVHAAAARLRSRAMVLVYLVLPVGKYTPFDAHYLPEAWTPVTRVSEPKNYRSSDDDPAGVTVLCAEIPCALGDATWTADAASLGATVTAALRRAELPEPHVTAVEVVRLPSAYPIYDLGVPSALEVLEGWLATQPRLLTFGRQGLFVHDNAHHALAMGWAAAAALEPPDGFDHAAWARAREGFAAHVVED